MSERHDVQEATLRNWANLGYITSSRIDNQLYLDDESLTAYLEAHKRLGVEEGYLAKIVEEKKLERDFIISKYDDLIYVLKTQKSCAPLYEVIIRELSGLIIHPGVRDIFYSISTGESIERVASRHRITYDRALHIYESHLKGLKLRKNLLANYRKRAMDSRFLLLADKDKNINLHQDERILKLPLYKVADARLSNTLHKDNVQTVGQLLELVYGKGWKWLLSIDGVGKISYERLLTNLHLVGVVDESLEKIVSDPSFG